MADRCNCGHHWNSHMKKIPPEHARAKNIRILTKAKHRWCVLCEAWHSDKDMPKDLK